jgi:hypothetical protein
MHPRTNKKSPALVVEYRNGLSIGYKKRELITPGVAETFENC